MFGVHTQVSFFCVGPRGGGPRGAGGGRGPGGRGSLRLAGGGAPVSVCACACVCLSLPGVIGAAPWLSRGRGGYPTLLGLAAAALPLGPGCPGGLGPVAWVSWGLTGGPGCRSPSAPGAWVSWGIPPWARLGPGASGPPPLRCRPPAPPRAHRPATPHYKTHRPPARPTRHHPKDHYQRSR